MPVRERDDHELTLFTLSSERLVVRQFDATDLPLIEEASRDSEIPKGTTVPAPYDDAAGAAFIERQHSRATTGFGWSMVMVASERSVPRPVGQVGLWLANAHHGRAEIGYWVVASARGNGYASEAVRLVSDWAFANLHVHRLGLFIEPWNSASIRTAERAGFEREALLRQWQTVDGAPKDMLSYVRLRSVPVS